MEPKGVVAASMPHWISVEEKLPIESGTYIVCTDKNAVMTTHFCLKDLRFSHHNKHITHWMPMPEPPKEANDAGTS